MQQLELQYRQHSQRLLLKLTLNNISIIGENGNSTCLTTCGHAASQLIQSVLQHRQLFRHDISHDPGTLEFMLHRCEFGLYEPIDLTRKADNVSIVEGLCIYRR